MKSGPSFLAALAVTVIAAAATPAGLATAGVHAEKERKGLDRYRPILRYDGEERYFAQPVSKESEVIDADRVYGRIATQDDRRYLQYWLFYAYNDQDRGLVRTGLHEGDWEFVQLRLGEDGTPDEFTFAQHSWAEVCSPSEIETVGDAPVIYVASGSHASYPRAGTADRPWPDPNDEAGGERREVRCWSAWPGSPRRPP